MKAGEAKIEGSCRPAGQEYQWLAHRLDPFGDRAFFNGDWLMRAAAAQAGIYGNDAVEAMYPMTSTHARRRTARRQQAQLHAHLPRRTTPAGECLLVGHDV